MPQETPAPALPPPRMALPCHVVGALDLGFPAARRTFLVSVLACSLLFACGCHRDLTIKSETGKVAFDGTYRINGTLYYLKYTYRITYDGTPENITWDQRVCVINGCTVRVESVMGDMTVRPDGSDVFEWVDASERALRKKRLAKVTGNMSYNPFKQQGWELVE